MKQGTMAGASSGTIELLSATDEELKFKVKVDDGWALDYLAICQVGHDTFIEDTDFLNDSSEEEYTVKIKVARPPLKQRFAKLRGECEGPLMLTACYFNEEENKVVARSEPFELPMPLIYPFWRACRDAYADDKDGDFLEIQVAIDNIQKICPDDPAMLATVRARIPCLVGCTRSHPHVELAEVPDLTCAHAPAVDVIPESRNGHAAAVRALSGGRQPRDSRAVQLGHLPVYKWRRPGFPGEDEDG